MFRLAENFAFHPINVEVDLAIGLQWRGGGGWCYDEKIDGERASLVDGKCFGRTRLKPFNVPASLNNCWLDGELAGGVFHAFDLMKLHGQDLRHEPLRFRRQALKDLIIHIDRPQIVGVASGQGGEFLEAVLARGGEGVVAKHLDSFYGESESWVKCKRQRTLDLCITEIHPAKRSVKLGDFGWCPVLGKEFQFLQVGQIVEVSCHSITAAGKLREPRFVRTRADKSHPLDGQSNLST